MTPKKPHPATERMFQAAREKRLLIGDDATSAMARLLNTSPQTVNNWRTRGPSKQARLDFQQRYGVSATWIESGDGDPFITPAGHIQAPPRNPMTAEAPPVEYLPQNTTRQQRIRQILELAHDLDDFGIVALLEKAKDLQRDYPLRKPHAS